ncbi:MAG TPA: CoA pyrophosphatase [candidate division Zixibacteria bacterium]|nr:CoA pyrophosphatase [candidate division Zixibacteria bacterium]
MSADEIAAALRRRVPRNLSGGTRPAAVLVPLEERADGEHLVLTKRAEWLNHHRGQIAFPGGTIDRGDDGPLEAALRETYEEIGVRPDHVRILGRLDQVTAGYDFVVTPFVGLIPSAYRFRVNPAETEEVFTVPIAALMEPGRLAVAERLSSGGEPVYHFYYEGRDIWGATARIIVQLLKVAYDYDVVHP